MSRRLLSGKGYSHGGGGGGYTGPGDIASGAFAWWGFRAYNNAYISGTKHLVDLLAPSGLIGTLITLDCDATGALPTGAGSPYAIWASSNSVTAGTALVTKLYDQTGNGRHLAQTTTAAMPTFNPTGVTSMSCFGGFGGLNIFSGNITIGQPYTISTIANRTVDTGGNAEFMENGGTGDYIFVTPASHFVGAFTGGQSTNSITLNTPFAFQVSGTGVYLDGILTSATFSGLAFSGAPLYLMSSNNDVMKITEFGLWTGDQGTHFAALNTNQHAAYGGF